MLTGGVSGIARSLASYSRVALVPRISGISGLVRCRVRRVVRLIVRGAVSSGGVVLRSRSRVARMRRTCVTARLVSSRVRRASGRTSLTSRSTSGGSVPKRLSCGCRRRLRRVRIGRRVSGTPGCGIRGASSSRGMWRGCGGVRLLGCVCRRVRCWRIVAIHASWLVVAVCGLARFRGCGREQFRGEVGDPGGAEGPLDGPGGAGVASVGGCAIGAA